MERRFSRSRRSLRLPIKHAGFGDAGTPLDLPRMAQRLASTATVARRGLSPAGSAPVEGPAVGAGSAWRAGHCIEAGGGRSARSLWFRDNHSSGYSFSTPAGHCGGDGVVGALPLSRASWSAAAELMDTPRAGSVPTRHARATDCNPQKKCHRREQCPASGLRDAVACSGGIFLPRLGGMVSAQVVPGGPPATW